MSKDEKRRRRVCIVLAATVAVGGLLSIWGVVGFRGGKPANADCVSTHECRQGLRCLDPDNGGPVDYGGGFCMDPLAFTRNERNVACQVDEAGCRWNGLCTSWRGKCVARSNADCVNSVVCTKQGRCRAANGRCVK